MRGLRQSMMLSRVQRGAEPKPARQFCGFVGEDVAIHIGGDDHVIAAGVAHQQRGHGVHELLLHLDVRIGFGDVARGFQKQPVRQAQDIRLVHDADFSTARHRQIEGLARNAQAGVARDLADRQGDIGRRHEFARPHEHRAVSIKTLGVLAHHDQIECLAAWRLDTVTRARGTDVGEKIEGLAQFARRVEPAFRDRRIDIMRHRTEHDAIGRARRLQHALGEGRAIRLQAREADVAGCEGEAKTEETIDMTQHVHGRLRDLRANAVTFEHEQVDAV